MFKIGARLRSQVCTTEVIVVKIAAADHEDLRCGGHPLIDIASQPDGSHKPDPGFAGGSQLGKRYTSDDGTLELLVTKPGGGSLALVDTPLALKEAKPLPSSD